jgi:hypothetical protein
MKIAARRFAAWARILVSRKRHGFPHEPVRSPADAGCHEDITA